MKGYATIMSEPKDTKTVKKPKNINFKKTSDKVAHVLIVTVCEATMAALAIQGMLSLVHTQHQLQVAISVGFVAALLIIRFRSK
jgi:hypothetical protein